VVVVVVVVVVMVVEETQESRNMHPAASNGAPLPVRVVRSSSS
jgi:hypothetical protein